MLFFFFNDTATTEIYTLSLHDALPIWREASQCEGRRVVGDGEREIGRGSTPSARGAVRPRGRPEGEPHGPDRKEHTSELQSRQYLVCRLLLEKKKKYNLQHDDTSNHTK